jgi:hypothetical protein
MGVAEQMPDFDVNGGYIEVRCQRADSAASRADLPDASAYPFAGEDFVGEELSVEDERLAADTEDWLMALFEPPAGEDRAPGMVDTARDFDERPLPEETPSVWRVRDSRHGHRARTGAGRAAAKPIGRRRRHARAACPFGRRVRMVGLAGKPRERRRIWTRCHRERPSAIG